MPNLKTAPKGPNEKGHTGYPPEPSHPSGPALVGPTQESSPKIGVGVRRIMSVLKFALPIVQSVLPLLDGKKGVADSHELTPQHHAPPVALVPEPVDLSPIESSLAELRSGHRELRAKSVEQIASLKIIEDRLKMVCEASNRNTLVTHELIGDLKGAGKRINLAAIIALGLLALSIGINTALYLHILKVLH